MSPNAANVSRMKPFIVLLIAVSATSPLAGQSTDVKRQLFAARDSIWHAWFTNDTTLLSRLLPPAAATVDGSGKQWRDRAQIVQESRDFALSNARLVGVTFENTQIALAGQSALLQSNYQTIIESAGRRDTTRGRATELFVRVGNTWTNPYWQLERAETRDARSQCSSSTSVRRRKCGSKASSNDP
ncbi:MAG: nuclear transport factor 2 family protein [bacterium]